MHLRILASVLLFSAVSCWPAWGVELTPFAVRNILPPTLVHGLATAEPARLNAPGRLSARLGFDLANTSTDNRSGDETILMDGQTTVATLGLRYGIADRLQLGIDLPWVRHSGGFLDNFISNFHDLFGMPNGDRDKRPDNELNYSYPEDTGEGFLVDDTVSGPGDVRMLLAWQWLDSEQLAASLHGSVKAPTGDANDLTGSEAWDASLALSMQRDFSLSRGEAAIWGGVGATWLGDGEVLKDMAEDWAVSGWLGTGWSPLDWLALKLQFDANSALYDSNLDQLGDTALILTLGGTLGLGEHTSLDLGVGEDLSINASPDVIFHLGLAHRF